MAGSLTGWMKQPWRGSCLGWSRPCVTACHAAKDCEQHLDNVRRKDALRGAETAEISVRLGNYSASHFEGSAHFKTFAHSGPENFYSSAPETLSVPPLSWQSEHHPDTLLVYSTECLYPSV